MYKERELDELISKYTDDLVKLKEKWSQWGIATEKETESSATSPMENAEIAAEAENEEEPDITTETTLQDTAVDPEGENKSNISPTEEIPLSEPENFAFFSAKVFSGNQAYPVPNAKVSVYLDGKLHIFIITDESGETKKVKLQSFPSLNAFIPENTQQVLDYTADVYADGFITRKGLLVSAVGGSDILLNVEMTPISERID